MTEGLTHEVDLVKADAALFNHASKDSQALLELLSHVSHIRFSKFAANVVA